MTTGPVVIIGAGHAGVQLAASLREEEFGGRIVLLSDDRALPYQRPPLSKAFLKAGPEGKGMPLRAEQFYVSKAIELRLGETVVNVDRPARRVGLASGDGLDYDHLVFATGARARPFSVPGVELDGVVSLRDLTDAQNLRKKLERANEILVVGAGFIGLELTAAAVGLGKRVRVVELGPRPLGRAVSAEISTFYRDSHAATGAELLFGAGISAIEGEDGCVTAALLSDGRRVSADLVIVGVGVLANDDLARKTGLDCQDGISVDEYLVTSDPSISAIGDCAHFPSHHVGQRARLESVQNAVDQAKCVARRLVGRPEAYRDLPWFWSDQGPLKLQIAGLSSGCDQWVARGDPAAGAFTMFGFRDGRLRVVETVNRPADHMIARRLIASDAAISPEQAANPAFDLKSLLTTA